MIIKVRLNGDDNLIYKLCEWNASQFVSSQVLKLQTADLLNVKEKFSNIEKLEIFEANVLTCEYTEYDTYSSISYLGQVYVSHENVFADCLQVNLQKTSLVDQIKRIEEALNSNVDVDAMSVTEYRNYMLKQVSQACKEDVYRGASISIDDEQRQFSFKAEDQINLLQLFLATQMYPTITTVPYHSDGQTCEFYTAAQIKTIYLTLAIRLLSLATYTNQLNQYAQTLNTKEEISNIYYGMPLPDAYAQVVADIVSQAEAALGDLSNEEVTENVN